MTRSSLNLAVPDRSLEQRHAALARANEIRHYRKELKTALKARETTVADVILDPDPLAATMKVYNLLIASPGLGRVKVNAILSAARVSPSKTLAGLSVRQRREVVKMLGSRGCTAYARARDAA